MTKIRVNVSHLVNNAKIRKEKRNGRDVIVVPSATLPDDVVMNGIRYPAAEIEKSYKSLERTPAPLGHPTRNGAFLSAKDPEGLTMGFIGAWNENVRRENGRVLLDKVIDVEYASQIANGKRVLEAIEKGEAIHTSTGLYGLQVPTVNDAEAKFTISAMVFDHDAILLDEQGAATPEQGVGMLVNKAIADDGTEVTAVNSMLDVYGDELDWAGERLLDAIDRVQRASRWAGLKTKVLSALGIETTTNHQTGAEGAPMDKAQMDELNNKLDGMTDKIATAVGAAVVKAFEPVANALTAMTNAQAAETEAKKTVLVNKVVKANLLGEETAKALPLAALEELVANAKLGTPAAIGRGATPAANTDDGKGTFKAPAATK